MEQDVTKAQPVGSSPPHGVARPVVDGMNSGLLRGVSGMHKPGEAPFDQQNRKEREENGDDVGEDGPRFARHAHPENEQAELVGKVGADGLARATYTSAAGVETEFVWDPARVGEPLEGVAVGASPE